jgi:hypothetical protein
MRFLVFMIPRDAQFIDGKHPDPHSVPDPVLMARMGRFNDELRSAGVLLSVDGLRPLTNGARLAFSSGKATLTDGPSVDATDVVGGCWMVRADSKHQVIEWMKRCPAEDGDVIEIRQVAEMSDFPPDVQAATRRWCRASAESALRLSSKGAPKSG